MGRKHALCSCRATAPKSKGAQVRASAQPSGAAVLLAGWRFPDPPMLKSPAKISKISACRQHTPAGGSNRRETDTLHRLPEHRDSCDRGRHLPTPEKFKYHLFQTTIQKKFLVGSDKRSPTAKFPFFCAPSLQNTNTPTDRTKASGRSWTRPLSLERRRKPALSSTQEKDVTL